MKNNEKFDILKLKGRLGKIRDYFLSRNVNPRLLFFLLGIISTVWFLIRVIPKPSRAAYPCMKVAAPFMSGFVLYLLTIAGLTAISRRMKKKVFNVRYAAAFLLVFGVVVTMAITPSGKSGYAVQTEDTKTGPDDGPNQPFGKAHGVYPGRVVWVWNPDATNEKCNSHFDTQDWYWKPENVNEKVVGEMIRSALTKLTGAKTVKKSWDVLFKAHNLKKKNVNKGYSKGEKIFIKINQGTSRWLLTDEDKKKGYYYPTTLKPDETQRRTSMGPTETVPYTVLEILRELVNEMGVNQSDIMVGDPMTHIYAYNYDVWAKEFPQVAYLDKFSTNFGRTMINPTEKEVVFYANGTPPEKLFDVHEKADYLINVANFKPHLSAGISLTAKNHFGSIAAPTAGHLHAALIVTRGNRPNNGGYGKYRVFVDIMGSKYLGQNTVLYMVDGLFGGGSSETKPPVKYLMAPFNNDWSNSIFMSMDQVALESVCYDFLRTEWNGQRTHNPINAVNEGNPNWHGVDDYLHQAADPKNWPAGIIYDPDKSGKPLSSMGVHEHWNNPQEKQYTRNLGTGTGIELVSVPENLVKSVPGKKK